MRALMMIALGLTAIGSPALAGPKPPPVSILTLTCRPGIFWSDVLNNTKKTVPAGATITVHGKEVPWTVNLNVFADLKPGQFINFIDAPPAIVHCIAQAKWSADTL